MVQENIINNNNSKNHAVNDIETYNNNCTPLSVKKKKKGSKKKVKFNDKVYVIKVESYKEFNKIDDNPYLDKLYKELYKENINKFNTIYNNNAQNKSNAKMVIIDEASMVDENLLYNLFQNLVLIQDKP